MLRHGRGGEYYELVFEFVHLGLDLLPQELDEVLSFLGIDNPLQLGIEIPVDLVLSLVSLVLFKLFPKPFDFGLQLVHPLIGLLKCVLVCSVDEQLPLQLALDIQDELVVAKLRLSNLHHLGSFGQSLDLCLNKQ